MDIDQIRKYTPQILKIAKKHGVTRIFVFGSAARGDTTVKSDVDFLVEMQKGVSLFHMAGFGYEIEKLLHIPVDVVPYSLLTQLKDQEFARHIQKEAVAL